MSTFPLYEPRDTASADAWHRVTSPGGYEWWYFDAEHGEQDVQMVGILFNGFVFHPGYLREYARYRRRPTRVSPPLPGHYPCAYLVIYENGKVLAQFMTQYAPEQFSASIERPQVTIGPNRLDPDADGALRLAMSGTPWRLTAGGPKLLEGCALSADLTFHPQLKTPPHERTFLSRRMTGAEHRWVIANALCGVQGHIRFGERTIAFTGRGYHDHNYGTGPLGPGLWRWSWGRMLLEDSALIFHAAEPSADPGAAEAHLIEADAAGFKDLPGNRPVNRPFDRRTGMLLRYPDDYQFGGVLRLTNPRVIDSSPFYLRLRYDGATEDGRRGRAFCEIAYPHRLRWPVLGRMIEMSIDRR